MHTFVPLEMTEAGRLEVTPAMTTEDTLAQDTLWNSLMLLLTVAAACIGIVVFSGIHLLGKPRNMLVEKAKQIGAGDFFGRIDLDGRTELNQLADAMSEVCDKLELKRTALDAEAASRLSAEKLMAYDWPGNIRERNGTERAVALTNYDTIAVEDLPDKTQRYKAVSSLYRRQ